MRILARMLLMVRESLSPALLFVVIAADVYLLEVSVGIEMLPSFQPPLRKHIIWVLMSNHLRLRFKPELSGKLLGVPVDLGVNHLAHVVLVLQLSLERWLLLFHCIKSIGDFDRVLHLPNKQGVIGGSIACWVRDLRQRGLTLINQILNAAHFPGFFICVLIVFVVMCLSWRVLGSYIVFVLGCYMEVLLHA